MSFSGDIKELYDNRSLSLVAVGIVIHVMKLEENFQVNSREFLGLIKFTSSFRCSMNSLFPFPWHFLQNPSSMWCYYLIISCRFCLIISLGNGWSLHNIYQTKPTHPTLQYQFSSVAYVSVILYLDPIQKNLFLKKYIYSIPERLSIIFLKTSVLLLAKNMKR